MNHLTLLKSLAAAALFTAIFVGFSTVQVNLPSLGVAVANFAALALLAMAAIDGYRRRSA